MSTPFINNMIESVAWNEASCVVSSVLLVYGSITSVVMIYIQAFLQGFALLFSVVGEKYGDTCLTDFVEHTVNTVAKHQPGTC